MAQFVIPGQSITANVEKDSPATTIPADVTEATVRLSDPNNQWGKRTGNITLWGVQVSSDNFATYQYLAFATGIPFGTLARDGGLPFLAVSSVRLAGNVVGITNVANPQVTTDVPHGLVAGQPVTVDGVQGATGVNGTWAVLSAVSPTAFTVAAASPGVYAGGGVVTTPTPIASSGQKFRLGVLTDAAIVLGCTVTTTP